MGEFEVFIWVAYAVTGLVMFWLLWRTIKELHTAENTLEKLQNMSGAGIASSRYVQTSAVGKLSQAVDQNA